MVQMVQMVPMAVWQYNAHFAGCSFAREETRLLAYDSSVGPVLRLEYAHQLHTCADLLEPKVAVLAPTTKEASHKQVRRREEIQQA